MKLTGLLLGLITLMAVNAQAVPLKVLFQDVKLPTQRVLERQVFTTPLASSTTYIESAINGPSSAAATTVTTVAHQPDVARNLEITPYTLAGPMTPLAACSLTVNGTDINGHSMSENFNFSSNSGAKQVGSYAFKTVTSIVWAASCENSPYTVLWQVGIGEKLGLKRCMDNAGDIGWSVYNGTKEATAPTMVVGNVASASANTADFVGTMDGAKSFILYYVQNYKCF